MYLWHKGTTPYCGTENLFDQPRMTMVIENNPTKAMHPLNLSFLFRKVLRLTGLGLMALAFILGQPAAEGQNVPNLLNFQGRILVGNKSFNGTGQFKFALVNGDNAALLWSNDGTPSGAPTAAISVTVTTLISTSCHNILFHVFHQHVRTSVYIVHRQKSDVNADMMKLLLYIKQSSC